MIQINPFQETALFWQRSREGILPEITEAWREEGGKCLSFYYISKVHKTQRERKIAPGPVKLLKREEKKEEKKEKKKDKKRKYY